MYLVERTVVVKALKSFDSFREGDFYTIWMTEQVANLIANHYLGLFFDPVWGLTAVPYRMEADDVVLDPD